MGGALSKRTILLRAMYGKVVDMCMPMGHDSAWFSHCVFSVAAELLAAVTASIPGVFLFSAGACNAVAHVLGAAVEGGKSARIDRIDSLEFVLFLQTAYFSSCDVVSVSPEFLRMHVHANHTCNSHIGRTIVACTLVFWSLTTSLASPLLVGRKLVHTELVKASLDIGGSPSPSVVVKFSYGGVYLLMVRLLTLILEYDKRVAFS